mmetsp:Transcript_16832/g.26260  ORF Transcript_16832/g.26260 Transcript_16832/m.26260 type:complete len:103 (+) Transcript_16832:513-821(+)
MFYLYFVVHHHHRKCKKNLPSIIARIFCWQLEYASLFLLCETLKCRELSKKSNMELFHHYTISHHRPHTTEAVCIVNCHRKIHPTLLETLLALKCSATRGKQ